LHGHCGVVGRVDHHRYEGGFNPVGRDRGDDHDSRNGHNIGDSHVRAWIDGDNHLSDVGHGGGGGSRHYELILKEVASVCRGLESRMWVGLQYLRSGHCVTGEDLSSPGC
jgi:hypothetical protein